MQLTYEAFCEEAELLVQRSQAAWQWRRGPREHLIGNAWLVSTGHVRSFARETEDSDAPIQEHGWIFDEDQTEMLEDESIAMPATEEVDLVLVDFHIVYHVIYQTPVLYFRSTRVDGTPVRYNPSDALHLAGMSSGRRTAVVSMEEHPVLGTPFSFLHPCETSAAMALLLHEPKQTQKKTPVYLLAWLSLVQPLTRISPLDYRFGQINFEMQRRGLAGADGLRKKSRALPSKPTPVRRAFGSRVPLSEKENMADQSNKPAASPSVGIVTKPLLSAAMRGVSKKRKLAANSSAASSPVTTATSTQKTIQPSKRPPTSLPPRPAAKETRTKTPAQSAPAKRLKTDAVSTPKASASADSTSATQPDFWRKRIAFVQSQMQELDALERQILQLRR